MLGRLLARFRGRETGSDEESADEEGDDGGGFVPSRLDASVLYAHGMGDPHAEFEMTSLREREQVFEEQQRRRNG